MPNLTVQDKSREFTHRIEGDRCTIGRAALNTIPIEDAKASKEHCEIVRRGDRWKLVDLESKNGTKVNGSYRNKAWLGHDDEITIGAARIRFGVEGARRAAAAGGQSRRAGTRAAGAAAVSPASSGSARARDPYEDDYYEERSGSRYGSDDSADKLLKYGGFALGAVLILLIASYFMRRASDDPYNVQLLQHADGLVTRGDYRAAIDYLEKNVDEDGAGYYEVVRRMDELRERLPVAAKAKREDEAKRLLEKLALRVKYYHQGKTRTTSPELILSICEELKTKYADTETTRLARREYEVWFAGQVPERAVDYIAGDAKLRRDWDEAVRLADGYRRENRFLQAIESITRFVAVREALLQAEELAYYERERDKQVKAYERLAESAYYARDRIARDLVKARRYDEAIQQFKQVIDRFGMDQYVRKAQAQITKIEELKRKRRG